MGCGEGEGHKNTSSFKTESTQIAFKSVKQEIALYTTQKHGRQYMKTAKKSCKRVFGEAGKEKEICWFLS